MTRQTTPRSREPVPLTITLFSRLTTHTNHITAYCRPHMKPPQPTMTTMVNVEEQTLRIERPHPHVRRHTHHTLHTYYAACHIFLGRTQRTQPARRLPNCTPWPHTRRSTLTWQPHTYTYNRFHDIYQKHALSDWSKNPSTHPILQPSKHGGANRLRTQTTVKM